MPAAERVFWRRNTATVWVGYSDAGELVFDGQDTEYLDGYEYRVSVAPGQFDRLRATLGAEPGADVVDVDCAHVEQIMARGERTWLDDHGIERDFISY